MAGMHFAVDWRRISTGWEVSDKTIQRILRHSNVAVTQGCYIKTADSEVAAAMQKFERSLEYAPSMHLSGADRQRFDVIDRSEGVR
jgi:CMP-2-keto-3-deoxyoctulosonic acid synthetase